MAATPRGIRRREPATLIDWHYLLNSLSYCVPFFERLVSLPPLQVVEDGKMPWRNLRREFLTEQELMGQLREQGIDDVTRVKSAYVDGNISVVPLDSAEQPSSTGRSAG